MPLPACSLYPPAASAPSASLCACRVKSHKVVVPKFQWTLEWALPTPVPLHQFEQSPVVIEVTDRHPDPEKLIANGPDPVGGYPDPENPAQMMTVEEHVARGYSRNYEREWSSVADKPAGAKQFAELYDGKLH